MIHAGKTLGPFSPNPDKADHGAIDYKVDLAKVKELAQTPQMTVFKMMHIFGNSTN